MDNRAYPRMRALKPATIAFTKATTLSCTIRDLSDHGYRLRLTIPQTLPERFALMLDRGIVNVRRIWQKGTECGVAIEA